MAGARIPRGSRRLNDTMNTYPVTAPAFDAEEIRLLSACLDSRWVASGPQVQQFEALFAARHQVPHALATTSCTAALHLATLALGLGPGDQVIVPAFTWITSANCAEYVGAQAVFADIDLATFNLDPEAVKASLTPKTRAIVMVHLFGLAAPVDELMAIARAHRLWVIEDAACAVGTTYAGTPVGGFGDLGCFSFHPRKVITTGEGGMVTTRHEAYANNVRILRNHGETGYLEALPERGHPYYMGAYRDLGYNLRLSDINAAVGVAQMAKLDGLLAERKRRAEYYTHLLREMDDIVLPPAPARCGHTYQSYVIRVREGGRQRRNRLMDFLDARRIQTRPGTHAVHRLEYYRDKYGLHPDMFPRACLGEDTTITLPVFPGMTEADQVFIAESVRDALRACPG